MNTELTLNYLPISAIQPSKDNPRQHPRAVRRQLAKMIKKHGVINPIVIDPENTIVAGHLRYAVALDLKLERVPVIQVTHLSPAELRAYRLADNRLVEQGSWDQGLLRVEIEFLIENEIDLDFSGFMAPEADLILEHVAENGVEDPPLPEWDDTAEPISQAGDVFQLGPHRILCGDILDRSVIHTLLGDKRVDSVLTDPPFNVPIQGHVSGLGQHKHAEFQMASGEMSSEEFEGFLKKALGNMASVTHDSGVHFVFMDWRHLPELHAASNDIYDCQLNLCFWNKISGGMGSLYRSQHELIGVYRVGSASHQNNVELGVHGRTRSNVWSYRGMSSFGPERDESLRAHPTVKPLALLADAMLDVTSPGDLILDGFLRSGSTLLAAERVGRVAYGVEIEPKYVDVALHRWYCMTGEEATHEQTGLLVSELEESGPCWNPCGNASQIS